jgi:hypothetical protein
MKPSANHKPHVDAARRAFLASAAALPAVALAAGAVPSLPEASPDPQVARTDGRAASRYRESAHVATYYRTAAF